MDPQILNIVKQISPNILLDATIFLNVLVAFCVIVFLVCVWMDQHYKRKEQEKLHPQKQKFNHQIVELLGCLILSDGQPTQDEEEEACQYFQDYYEESDAQKMCDELKAYLKNEEQKIKTGSYKRPNLEHLIGEMYYDNTLGEKEFLRLFTTLYHIAAVDSCINDAEFDIICTFVNKARISRIDEETLANRYKKYRNNNKKEEYKSNSKQKHEKKKEKHEILDNEWAYGVLKLHIGASQDKIKEAYHKLAMEYHPDRHAGESEERIDFYTEKFRHVNEAYELLINS